MDIDSRYNEWHEYNGIKFYLSGYTPNIEEVRFVMLKTLEQAIRDYVSMSMCQLPSDKQIWENAKEFLFNDEYYISWGNMDMNLEDMLDILDLDLDWVRESVIIKFRKAKNESR